MKKYSYKLVQKELLTPSILSIILEPTSKNALTFTPGQYAAISYRSDKGPSPARCFSLASAPSAGLKLEFAMRVRGRFTNSLSKIPVGTKFSIIGPFGGFTLDSVVYSQAVLIAGGIGITPFMSIIRETVNTESNNRLALIYSVQSQNDVAFKDELMNIDKNHPHIAVRFAVSVGAVDMLPKNKATTGRVSSQLIDKVVNNSYEHKKFYICGPSGFMDAMRKILLSKNVPEQDIITEAFSQGGKNQTEKILSWPANMYALSTLAVLIGMLALLAGDVIGTLPKPSNPSDQTISGGYSTQEQIDKTISKIAPTIKKSTAKTTVQTTVTTARPSPTVTPIPRTTVS